MGEGVDEEEKHALATLAWAKQHGKSSDDPLISLVLTAYARDEGFPVHKDHPFGLDSFEDLQKAYKRVSEYMQKNNTEPSIAHTIERGIWNSFVGRHGWKIRM